MMSARVYDGFVIRAAAIINPRSANGQTGQRLARIESLLRSQFRGIETRLSESPGHATEIVREWLDTGVDLIVAVGGDGTFNEAVNGFFQDEKPVRPGACLAVLPAGNGTDLARSLKIPTNFEGALSAVASASPITIDVGRACFQDAGQRGTRYFVNMASFGLGGEVTLSRRNARHKIAGTPGYLLAALSAVWRNRPCNIRFEIDGARPFEMRVLHAGAGNGPYHGGGMRICPAAILDDGLLDITVIEPIGAFDVLFHLPLIYSGGIHRHPKVKHFRAARVAASADAPVIFEIDGEPVGGLPVELTVLPRSLNVLVPAIR